MSIYVGRGAPAWRAYFLFLIGALVMVNGCAETAVGGMTAAQAFSDRNVTTAEWVVAVEHADYTKADRLLAQGADVNLIGHQGITPLLWIMGARRPDVERIGYMLKSGANPNYIEPSRMVSPMYFAAGGDNPEVLRILLRNSGNPNLAAPSFATGETTLLAIAGMQGRFDNVKLLVEAGADVNWLDRDGLPPAAMSAQVPGRFDIVAYLLDHGMHVKLDKLLWSVEHCPLPPDSEQNVWKDKVIAMLKMKLGRQ